MHPLVSALGFVCVQEIEMQNLEKHVSFENENSRKAYYREFKKVSGKHMLMHLNFSSLHNGLMDVFVVDV